MDPQQLIDHATALRENFYRIVKEANSTRGERRLLREIADQLFGKNYYINQRCGNCWGDALVDILSHLNISFKSNQKPTPMTTAKGKFELHAHKVLMAFGSSHGVGNKELTDDYALKILRKMRPERREKWLANNFNRYPSDWKELIGESTLEIETVVPPVVTGDENESSANSANAEKPLDKMNRAELAAYAQSAEFPEAEWNKKNRNALLSYLMEKKAQKS